MDLWSLGATCAEFFTALRLRSDENDAYDSDEDVDETSTHLRQAFILPEDGWQDLSWSRDSLFNAERGSIGLAWSIFKIRGSPTVETWPVRQHTILPHSMLIYM